MTIEIFSQNRQFTVKSATKPPEEFGLTVYVAFLFKDASQMA